MAFNGRFLVNLAHFASSQGSDKDRLLALSGKSESELNKETCVVESDIYNMMLEKAIEETKDEYFGMHAGENLNLAAAGLIGQITQTCDTVKQALEYCCEFANLGCSSLPMQLLEEKDHYKLSMKANELWKSQSSIAVRHTAEGVIAFAIREFQSLTHNKHDPIAIYLDWDQFGKLEEYQRVFSAPVHFNKNEIAILFNKKDIEDKVVSSDYDLLRILVAHAEEKSALIKDESGFAAIVKQSLIKLLKPDFPTLEIVSSHLNVSPRTLQRRLNEEGQTFNKLIDDIRKQFAMSYLKQNDLNISEIAYLLNYADTSSFIRSFKRWTGKTPKKFRQVA